MDIRSRLQQGKPLSSLSTFGIGGSARLFIEVSTVSEMQEVMRFVRAENLAFWVVGKGSNSLFNDRGFDGLVIHNKIDFFRETAGRFEVGAGYSFSLLGVKTARQGWAGLEFASGIPGTVGGAVYMNAGASGGETADHLISVSYVDQEGKCITRQKSELEFQYRFSSFHRMKVVIVSAVFELEKNLEARKKQIDIVRYRSATQPYGEKSAGCVFRNREQGGTGALIEKCGLKGLRVGGAEVSDLHANFIVNKGQAKAQDVLDLIEKIRAVVREKTGEELEMEMRPIPYQLEEEGR